MDLSSSFSLRRAGVCSLVIAAALLAFGISGAFGQGALQPADWDAGLALPQLEDVNPDPRILEVNMEARVADVEIAPGRAVTAWTYEGGLPGPLLRLNVGDRLIVHFTNNLPQPTTIHWHGLRVPIEMDGVPGVSQPDIEPGGSFTYDFIVRDAGLFWYHPHVMSAAQVGFGLYGALLVDDPEENVGVEDELIIVLSDIDLTEEDELQRPDLGGSTAMAFGREGNVVLVNGRVRPTVPMNAGVPQRWRVVNAAKSRYFLLDLDGATFTTIGGDGGLQESPEESTEVLLAAGERADVIVTPAIGPGERVELVSLLHNRGYGSVEFRNVQTLIDFVATDRPAYAAPPLPAIGRTIEPLSTEGATEVAIDLTIGLSREGKFEYGINGVPFATARPFLATLGETQIWRVRNTTDWSHPMHLHGFFFQVLDEHDQPVRPLEWKDTVNVPFKQSLSFVVKFDERPGAWMYHCHILDHADGGLMGFVHVDTPAEATATHDHR